MPRRLVLFDVDGTLVDSRRIILAAMDRTAAALGQPRPSDDFVLAGVGLSLDPAMRRLFGQDQSDAFIQTAIEAYKDAFHALRADPAHHEPLFDGAQAVIDALALRDDVAIGLATGKSRRGVAHLLERFDWLSRFDTIQTADDAPSKPHPGMVLRAIDETGIAAHETLVIGDTSYDMEMALSAGATAIGVSWGNHAADALKKAGANTILTSFDELQGLMDPPGQDRHER